MTVNKRFFKTVVNFYKKNENLIKPQKCVFFKTKNELVSACCAIGAAVLAKDKYYNNFCQNDMNEFAEILNLDEEFLDGVIDGFDSRRKNPSSTLLEKVGNPKKFINGFETGKAIQQEVFKK